MIDYSLMEKKWRSEWEKSRIFEHEINDKKPLLVTAAWPYVNMPPHIGHLRTYGTADFYSKYMRMRGYNVMFPMGWHYTGTPILAIVKRLNENDQSLIEELKDFEISEEDIKKLTTPLAVANFFQKQFKEAFSMAGMGIDWRSEFISIDPLYSKMVDWQFKGLMEKGFLVKGKHPLGWCNNENNAVGQHDTKGDVQPEIEKMFMVKFKVNGEEAYFACATYRPETLYGATNLFINKNAEYVLARIGNDRCYVSKDSLELISGQYNTVTEKPVEPSELLQKTAINPIDSKELPVLNGDFVKSDFGTGVVMAVPAHAPFDYVALSKPENKEAKIDRNYVAVIKLAEPKEEAMLPSLLYLKKENDEIASITEEQVIAATKKLYRDEQRNGVMNVGKYSGMGVSAAREAIASDLEKSGALSYLYIIANEKPVYCRCGHKVTVKIIDDQWFIDYGNKGWKEKVLEHMPNLLVYPEKLKGALNASIDWIDLRAAERAQGLGTKFPFSEGHIIESLSDSTLYMAFYTLIPILRRANAKPEQLVPEFFDYVYKGSGKLEEVAKLAKMDPETVKKCRESFSYWYKFTSRHSASELIPSHITMYLFNHVAFFDRDNWPRQVVLNGMVNYKGQKMSKSLGNVIPVQKAIREYGADPIRFLQVLSADLSNDADFSPEGVESVKAKLAFLSDIVDGVASMSSGPLTHMDYWLYSKLNTKIRNVTSAMEMLSVRTAYIDAFYESVNELKWYMDRTTPNQIVVSEYLEKLLLMLAPAMPFITEELWHKLGKTTFILTGQWPEFDESMISGKEIAIEDSIIATIDDVSKAVSLTMPKGSEAKPKEVSLIFASDWKGTAYNALCKEKKMDKVLALDELKGVDKQALAKFLSKYLKSLNSMQKLPDISQKDMIGAFSEALPFIEKKLGYKLNLVKEQESESQRAQRAEPLKPSIDVKW